MKNREVITQAVTDSIPQDGLYGQAAASAINNVSIGEDGSMQLDYSGMASDMLAQNEVTAPFSGAIDSPIGQCAVGSAEIYGGIQSGNPMMVLDGSKKVLDNYSEAIDQVKDSPVGHGVEKVCDDLTKMKESCENISQQMGSGGGGCSGGSGGSSDGDNCSSMCVCEHKSPETPKLKLEIEENDLPENWWDRLPDFDPRVFDAILMEQSKACVDYIFSGLPDMHDLEHQIESNKNPKTCPRLTTSVPRTKVIKPLEIIYDTPVDAFIKTDQTY